MCRLDKARGLRRDAAIDKWRVPKQRGTVGHGKGQGRVVRDQNQVEWIRLIAFPHQRQHQRNVLIIRMTFPIQIFRRDVDARESVFQRSHQRVFQTFRP
jgi:hypothetical protein